MSNLRDQFMLTDCGHIVVVDDAPSQGQTVSTDDQVLRLRRKLEIDPRA
jgi:hypothetical protein